MEWAVCPRVWAGIEPATNHFFGEAGVTRVSLISVSSWENYLFNLGLFFGSEPILKNGIFLNRIFWRITGCCFGKGAVLGIFSLSGGYFRLEKQLNWCLLDKRLLPNGQ